MWLRRPRHHVPRVAIGVACALALTGCITGERPSFEDEQQSIEGTGEPQIDAVLARLDAVGASLGTAEYEIESANGDATDAVVVLADSGRRSITVGDVRYLVEGGAGITCSLASAECETSLNDARISDLQLTHEFYSPAFARRLRVDADRRIQSPTSYSEEVDGIDSLCVVVPVTGGEKTYCALESGVLSRYSGPDTAIELVGYRATPDEELFSTGT